MFSKKMTTTLFSKKNVALFILFSFIFLISFFWMFGLTYNFPLFWEDSSYVEAYNKYSNNPEQYSFFTFFNTFIDLFASPVHLYKVTQSWRFMERLFYSPFVIAAFGLNPILLRGVKTLIFAGLITLYFSILYSLCSELAKNKLSKFSINAYVLLPFLLLNYLLFIPELWITALYLTDTLTYTLFFSTLAIILFYLFYNDDAIQNKTLLFILFLSIVFLTRFSVLIQNVGRIIFIIFFTFIVFTERKKLLQFRYWSLILVLFCLSFPILGILGIFSGESVLNILGLTENASISEEGLFKTFFTFFSSIYLSFLPHAFFLVILFFIFVFLHLYTIFVKREELNQKIETISQTKNSHFLGSRKLLIFSFFWFILSVAIMFAARGLVFDSKSFLRFEFTVFIFPQVLFLLSYCSYIHKKYFFSHKILHYIIILFVVLSIFHNASRLNEWRGGWGAYFLGYDSARQFVDDHSNNSILLFPFDHASPTYFNPLKSTNTQAMVLELNNVSSIRPYTANYSTVYIANREQLVFDSKEVINIANLTIKDNSPYGKIKKTIGKYYKQPIHLYTLKIY